MGISINTRAILRKTAATTRRKGNIFSMSKLVSGDTETIERFQDKARALQLFNDEFRYESDPVSVDAIPYIVERFIKVLKEFDSTYPEIFKDVDITLVGNRLSLDYFGNSYTDGTRVVVVDNLRPEIVAHELGHIVDLKNSKIKKFLHTGAKLVNQGYQVVTPILLGRLGLEGNPKKYLGITAGLTALDVLASKYVESREKAATEKAHNALGNTGDTARILDNALDTYSLKNRLLNYTLPSFAAGGAAYGLGKALRRYKGNDIGVADLAGVYTTGIVGQGLLAERFPQSVSGKDSSLYRYLSDPLKI